MSLQSLNVASMCITRTSNSRVGFDFVHAGCLDASICIVVLERAVVYKRVNVLVVVHDCGAGKPACLSLFQIMMSPIKTWAFESAASQILVVWTRFGGSDCLL